MNGNKDRMVGFLAGGVVMMILGGFIQDIFEGFDSQREMNEQLSRLKLQIQYLERGCRQPPAEHD